MSAIKLNDILRIPDVDLKDVKIRLNLSNESWNALHHYNSNKERLLIGHFHNSEKRQWFKKDNIVIGLAQITKEEWLLIDISKIKSEKEKLWDGRVNASINTFYEHERIKVFEKYIDRLILNFHKTGRGVTLSGNHIGKFEVKTILPCVFENDIFPGYDKVNISWDELSAVIKKDTWITALQNQKGVYLITDTSNGKKYVGAAYGEEMIFERWKSYVRSGHGGNTELRRLHFDHIKKNFRYSILDIYKSTTDSQTITDRESWWKKVLQTRRFGYNDN